MSGVRDYLLRLILCGFFVSLICAWSAQPRIRRILRLCGGCLLLLTALQPLLRVDWSALPDRLGELGLERATITAEEAKARNEELLCRLVQSQTEQRILRQAGIWAEAVTVEVEAGRDPETGLPSPRAVRIRGTVPEQTRRELSEYMTRELGIPAERQVWTDR